MIRFCCKTENFAKSAQFWFQSVPLVLTKKTSTHTLCFCPQITKLLGVLSDHAMAHTCTVSVALSKRTVRASAACM